VLVFLEDGACLKITEQELLDFGLRSGDELSAARLTQRRRRRASPTPRPAAADLIASGP
jgi:regulatory protein